MRRILISLLFIFANNSYAGLPKIEIGYVQDNDYLIEKTKVILKQAYKTVGYDVRFRRAPAERLLLMVSKGTIDGDIFRISDLDVSYDNLVQVTPHLFQIEHFAYTSNSNLIIRELDDLKVHNVGYYRGYKLAEKYLKKYSPVVLVSSSQVFAMLKKGRIDVAIATIPMEKSAISEIGSIKLYKHKGLFPETKLFHYLHKKHSGLAKELSKELVKMKKEGKLTLL